MAAIVAPRLVLAAVPRAAEEPPQPPHGVTRFPVEAVINNPTPSFRRTSATAWTNADSLTRADAASNESETETNQMKNKTGSEPTDRATASSQPRNKCSQATRHRPAIGRVFTRAAMSMLLMASLSGPSAFAGPSQSSQEIIELKKKVAAQEALIQELLEWKKQVEASMPSAARKAEAGLEKRAVPPEAPPEERAVVSEARPHFPDLEFHGFGDVTYHASDRQGDKNAFALGQLDFFITSRLSENVSLLAENVVEAGSDNEFKIEIERLLLQVSLSDYLNVAAGRYHTAIGYYNTAYHHGQWFQTAVRRPSLFAFEDDDGILPIHNVGVSIGGSIPSGNLGLHYVMEVGNGRDYNPGSAPVLNISDNDDYKAVNLAILAQPDWPSGLQTGLSGYHDRLTLNGKPRVDQSIFAGHAVYKTPKFEWLNEAALLRHDPSGRDGAHYTSGFYTQIAQQFGLFEPYLRYQYLHVSDNDPVLSPLRITGVQHGPSIGLRYDFTDYAALKLQFDHTFNGNHDSVNEFTLQPAFTF